jgi:RecA-family ATPase
MPTFEWCVEPVIPAGKMVGIVSRRGAGKSLLTLDILACRAVGRPTLHQRSSDPVHVVYLDQEMGPNDLYERFANLGWLSDEPDFGELVDNLHYYQLAAIPPLDKESGGLALEQLIDRHDAKVVVIDTVSRVISGRENDAEPFLEMYRHTETRLKRRGITQVRLDHLGKGPGRGSRGHSAKEDALDVV